MRRNAALEERQNRQEVQQAKAIERMKYFSLITDDSEANGPTQLRKGTIFASQQQVEHVNSLLLRSELMQEALEKQKIAELKAEKQQAVEKPNDLCFSKTSDKTSNLTVAENMNMHMFDTNALVNQVANIWADKVPPSDSQQLRYHLDNMNLLDVPPTEGASMCSISNMGDDDAEKVSSKLKILDP